MYRRLRCLLLLLCLALPGAAAGAEGAVEEQLARMFEKYSTLGASVAVFQNGSVTYTYTYGQIRPDVYKRQDRYRRLFRKRQQT